MIYGDGTSTPLTLRDWGLVDYDHIWEQGVSYSIPHCIAETHQQLVHRIKEYVTMEDVCVCVCVSLLV